MPTLPYIWGLVAGARANQAEKITAIKLNQTADAIISLTPVAIAGSETIVGLAAGQTTEITVNHSVAANFALGEYPRITAPTGVRVRVLAVSGTIAGAATSGSGFVLQIENLSFVPGSGASSNIVLPWTRKGIL